MFQGCIEMNKLCERLHGLSTDSSMLGTCETSWQRPLRSVSTGIPNGFEVENVTGNWGNLSCKVSLEPMSNIGFPNHKKKLIRNSWFFDSKSPRTPFPFTLHRSRTKIRSRLALGHQPERGATGHWPRRGWPWSTPKKRWCLSSFS